MGTLRSHNGEVYTAGTVSLLCRATVNRCRISVHLSTLPGPYINMTAPPPVNPHSMWTSLIVGMAVALTIFNVVLYLNKHDIMGAPTVML